MLKFWTLDPRPRPSVLWVNMVWPRATFGKGSLGKGKTKGAA